MPHTTGEAGGPGGEVTQLLQRLKDGDRDALDRLFPLVLAELRRAAGRLLVQERVGHTLQPTALVHEAYLKLAGQAGVDWQNRSHFLAVSARAMRQILVDHARKRNAAKRGGGAVHAPLTAADHVAVNLPVAELLSLNDALDRLDAVEPRLRQVVEFRFFAGMTEEEIAEALGVTPRTVQRDWVKARAWLHKEIYSESAGPPRS